MERALACICCTTPSPACLRAPASSCLGWGGSVDVLLWLWDPTSWRRHLVCRAPFVTVMIFWWCFSSSNLSRMPGCVTLAIGTVTSSAHQQRENSNGGSGGMAGCLRGLRKGSFGGYRPAGICTSKKTQKAPVCQAWNTCYLAWNYFCFLFKSGKREQSDCLFYKWIWKVVGEAEVLLFGLENTQKLLVEICKHRIAIWQDTRASTLCRNKDSFLLKR